MRKSRRKRKWGRPYLVKLVNDDPPLMGYVIDKIHTYTVYTYCNKKWHSDTAEFKFLSGIVWKDLDTPYWDATGYVCKSVREARDIVKSANSILWE